MKKLLKIVLAATLITSVLVGCGNKEKVTESDSIEVASEETQELNQEPSEEAMSNEEMQALIDEFFPLIENKEELPQLTEMKDGEEIAILKTSYGDVYLRLFPEIAPNGVENFKKLAESGYYNGLTFHRIINDFMIQGGDPLGNGTGGESFEGGKLDDEISPYLKHFSGAVAYANSGPNTNGSQFYIVENTMLDPQIVSQFQYFGENPDLMLPLTNEENGPELKTSTAYPEFVLEEYITKGGTPHLDGGYTIFGQVYEGMDVVNKIAEVEISEDGESPVEPVIIDSIEISTYIK